MNQTQDKIREMMEQENIANRKETINNNPDHTTSKNNLFKPKSKDQKQLIRNLLYILFFIIVAAGSFYGASVSKQTITEKYQQRLELNAQKNLEALMTQAILTLSHKINNFNYILRDAEYIKNFHLSSWQELLKTELSALLGDQAVIEIIPTDFSSDVIIDNSYLGYAVLALLNELKETENTRSASHLRVEVHRANSPNSRLIFVRKVTYRDVELKKDVAIGYIVASLSPEFLNKLLAEFNPKTGYMELIQSFSGKSSVLAKRGDATLKNLPTFVSKKMNNTQWLFNFWPEEQRFEIPTLLFWQAISYLGLGSLAFVSALVLLFKVVRKYRLAQYIALPSKSTNPQGKTPDDKTKSPAAQAIDDVMFKHNNGISVEEGDESQSDELQLIVNNIFKAYDIRGEVGTFITPEIFKQIACAIANEMTEIQQSKIAIGCDGRNSSPELVKVLIETLLENGIDVIDVGMVTSPILYFTALTRSEGNGIVVTASHNPANFNGMKFMLAGHSYNSTSLEKLKQRVIRGERVAHVAKAGELVQINILEDYINKIMANIVLARPMKIVIDTANGVTGKFARTFFEQLGCKVTALNTEVDGNFPNHEPDPGRPENLTELIQTVAEVKADIGIAFDGDGDRIGVVSSGGEIIWPDRVLMLLAKDILSRNKDATILYDVKSSGKLEKFIKTLGGKPIMCQSGHSFMKSKLLETRALLAGEMSGHIFIKERWFGFDDALFVAARMLEILSIDLRKSRQVFAELPDSLNTPEILIATDQGHNIMAKMNNDLEFFNEAKVITIDGIRAEFSDGWGLVRASNTTDNLTMRFEADDEAALQRIANLFKEAILKAAPGIDFPF
jgi:phosphomannomutase / phosphoglucomutase